MCAIFTISLDSRAANGKLVGKLYEELSEKTDVSANDVVGIWFGDSNTELLLQQSQIVVPVSTDIPIEVCFSATTLDGLYYSSGVLIATSNNTGVLDVVPLRNSQYLHTLTRYRVHQFAPLARLGKDCLENNKSPFAPIRYTDESELLFIAIQSRRSQTVAVQLKFDTSFIKGNCDKLGPDRRVSYDVVCSLKLPSELKHGTYSFSIEKQPRAGPFRVDHFEVIL